jgi:hypothetical protein
MVDKEKARELVNDLIKRGLIDNNDVAIADQIEEITKWNDDAFDRAGRVVNKYATARGKTFDSIPGKHNTIEWKQQTKQDKHKSNWLSRLYVRCWLDIMMVVAVIIRNIMLHCLGILHIDPKSVPRDIEFEQFLIDLKANMNMFEAGPTWTIDAEDNDPLELPKVKEVLRFITRKTPHPTKPRKVLSIKKPRRPVVKKAAKTIRKKK